jgi:hypothetical protein
MVAAVEEEARLIDVFGRLALIPCASLGLSDALCLVPRSVLYRPNNG